MRENKTKDSLDEIQPIDGYVRNLLESAVKNYHVKVDLENPTRGQRLEAALAMQNEGNGFYSIEIMVGRRVDSSEPFVQTLSFLKITQAMFHQDLKIFYDGFAHLYWPEQNKTDFNDKK